MLKWGNIQEDVYVVVEGRGGVGQGDGDGGEDEADRRRRKENSIIYYFKPCIHF